MPIRTTTFAALLALPVAAVAQQQNWKPVSVEELRRDVVGKPMATVLANRSEGAFLLAADGKVSFRSTNLLEGTWRAWDKGYCTTYPSLRSGAEACFEIIRLADGTFEVYTDKGQFQGRMRPQ